MHFMGVSVRLGMHKCAALRRLLMHDLLPYLKRLAELPDVRQPLTEDFKMAEYFRRQGYLLYEDPASGFLTAAASVIS